MNYGAQKLDTLFCVESSLAPLAHRLVCTYLYCVESFLASSEHRSVCTYLYCVESFLAPLAHISVCVCTFIVPIVANKEMDFLSARNLKK